MRPTARLAARASLLVLCALAACNRSTPIPAWTPTLPEAWQAAPLTGVATPQPITAAPAATVVWWNIWRDAALTGVVEQALAQNLALQEVVARVEKAEALRAEAEASLWPRVQGASDAMRANQGLLTRNNAETITDAKLQASWELDLFGKLRAVEKAAQADTIASAAMLRSAKLMLIKEVVAAYIDLRHAQAQRRIAEATIAAQTDQVGLLEVREKAGIDNGLATRQARSVLLNAHTQLPQWQAAERAALNRLNLLAAVRVGTLDAELAATPEGDTGAGLPPVPPNVALTAPAAVIAQRPDVAEKQARLAFATAMQEVAIANQYPSITLSSLFGLQYTSSFDTAKIWSIAAGAAAPVLSFGRLQAQIDQADAEARGAFAAYKASILVALEETETALSRYLYALQQVEEQQKLLENSTELKALATERYQQGISTYLDVLDAERQRFAAQSGLATARAGAARQLLAMYVALGVGA